MLNILTAMTALTASNIGVVTLRIISYNLSIVKISCEVKISNACLYQISVTYNEFD